MERVLEDAAVGRCQVSQLLAGARPCVHRVSSQGS